jgi:hypothetical protein
MKMPEVGGRLAGLSGAAGGTMGPNGAGEAATTGPGGCVETPGSLGNPTPGGPRKAEESWTRYPLHILFGWSMDTRGSFTWGFAFLFPLCAMTLIGDC